MYPLSLLCTKHYCFVTGQIESTNCQRHTQTGSVLVEIEEPAGTTDDAGRSTPTQAFLSSADKAGVPELSIPRSPCPAEAAAAVVLVPACASAEMETAKKGGAGLNGESDVHGHGVGGGRAVRRQVSDDAL